MNQSIAPPTLLPPHYLALALVLMLGLDFAFPTAALAVTGTARPITLALGLLLIVGGILLAVQGSRLFAKVGTNIIPFSQSTTLVNSGVFAYSRNPMYLGMVLTLTGLALCLNHLMPWIVVAVFYCIIRWRFITHEEQLLEATFGQAYLDYKATVRRWL